MDTIDTKIFRDINFEDVTLQAGALDKATIDKLPGRALNGEIEVRPPIFVSSAISVVDDPGFF